MLLFTMISACIKSNDQNEGLENEADNKIYKVVDENDMTIKIPKH